MAVKIRYRQIATPNRQRWERPTYDDYQVVGQGGRILYRAEVLCMAQDWCKENGFEITEQPKY